MSTFEELLETAEQSLTRLDTSCGKLHADLAKVKSLRADAHTAVSELRQRILGGAATAAPVPDPAAAPAASPAPVAQDPPPPPVPPAAHPAPVPVPAPMVPARYTFTGVGTCWLNEEDEGGVGGSLADGTPFTAGLGKSLVAVSLPCPLKKGRLVHVWLPSDPHNVLICAQRDVGPWSTKWDPALGHLPPAVAWIGQKVIQDHKAPFGGWVPVAQAVEPHGNPLTCGGAIVDITPAGWKFLNGNSAEENWSASPSATVCFQIIEPDGSQLVPAPAPVPNTHPTGDPTAAIVKALLALVGHPTGPNDPFQYDPLTNGGRLACAQAISTALVAAGVLPHIELSVDGLRAALHRIGSRVVADHKPARIVILGALPTTNGHGHVGGLVDEGGAAHLINNHSSTQRVGDDVFDPAARPVVEILAVPGAA